MAKQLNVNLKVSADTAAAQQALKGLSQSLTAIQNTSSAAFKNLNLDNAKEAARDLQTHLQKAVNVDTGKLDLNKFSASLTKSNQNLTVLSQRLLQGGTNGQKAFTQLTRSIALADNQALNLGTKLNSLLTTLKNTTRWQISSSILHGFMSTISGAYTYAQKLNESLTNIQIVTEASSEKMAKFAKEANKAAQALNTTTNTYAKAALIYYQQGLDDKQVKERTDLTVKMANVTGNTAKTVSEQLTAIWNNFDDGSRSLESYIDVITALGASTASSTTEIAEGLEKFAAIARTVGLSYEYATSALATVVAKTRQSADVVGTAFKTLFARIQDLELGKTLDDGTTLGRYSEALKAIGVNIKNANGELKDMDDILNELGAKWDQIDRGTQVAVAQAVGGTRQYQQLIAILDNWDYMQENLNVAAESEGTLSRQAEIYAESWEAAKNRVKASAEEIYHALLDDKFFISLTNGFSKFLNGINAVMESLGGLKGILGMISQIVLLKYAKELPAFMSSMINDLGILVGLGDKRKQAMLNETAELAKQNALAVNGNSQYTTSAQREAILTAEIATRTAEMADKTKNLTNAKKEEYAQRIKNCQAIADEIVKMSQEAEAAENTSKKIAEAQGTRLADYRIQRMGGSADEATTRTIRNETKQDVETYRQAVQKEEYLNHITGNASTTFTSYNTQLGLVNTPGISEHGKQTQLATVKSDMLGFSESYKSAIGMSQGSFENTQAYEAQLKTVEKFQTVLKDSKSTVKDVEKAFKEFEETTKTGYKAMTDQASTYSKQQEDIIDKYHAEGVTNPSKYFNPVDDSARTAGILEGQADDAFHKGFGKEDPENNLLDINHNAKISQTITDITTGLMSLSMAITAVQQLGSIWSNDDLTTGQKIIQSLSSMAMLIPTVISLAKILRVEKLAQIITNKALKKSEKEVGDEAVKSGLKAQAALGSIGLIIAGIVAAIVLLIGLITLVAKKFSDWYNKDKIESEKAAKSAERLAEAYKSVKAAYDEMLKSISDYRDGQTALDKLTQGTKEYETALKEANKQALSLISKYKLIKDADYSITSDGRIIIKSESLRRISNEAEQKIITTENVSNSANLRAQQAADKAQNTQLKRSIAGDQGKNDLWWGIGGGIAATAALFIPVVGPLVSAIIGAGAIAASEAIDSNIAKKEASYDTVMEALRSGELNINSDTTYTEFSEKLEALGIQDEKLIQALYDNKDSLDQLAESYNTNKELEQQQALQIARDTLGTDENLVASGALPDLANIGKDIISKAQEQTEATWRNTYANNKDSIGRDYFNAYKDSLGEKVSYLGNGKYRYYDTDAKKYKEAEIDEQDLKSFYKVQQGQNALIKNKNQIIEAYSATANNAAARSALVNKNFEGATRQEFDDFLKLSNTEMAQALGVKDSSSEGLNKYAQEVLGVDSWDTYLATIYKAKEDNAKAWESFNASAAANLAHINGINLETAQRFANIMNEMKNNPLYSQNANFISQGIEQLAGSSNEALKALSQLDYSSYDIGRQVKNTLANLGIQLSMSEDDFEHWVKDVRQTHNTIPTFNDLLTNLNNIDAVLENIDFGKTISREDYETLTAYNVELKRMFQYVGDNKFRFNGNKAELTKSIEAQTAQELNDLKQYIEISKQLKENDRLTSQILIGEGASTSTVNSRAHAIDAIFSATTDSQGNQVDSVWSILKKYNPEYDEGFFREQRSRDEINELLTLYNNLFTASERSTELMQQQSSYAKDIAKLNEQLKNGEIDEETYKQQLDHIKYAAKESLKYAKDIIKEIEYLNRLLSRQQKITETLYGANKLASLEEESKLIDQVIASTQDEIATLKEELKIRMALLKAKGTNFDSTGKMTNGWQLYREGIISKEDLDAYQELWETLLDAEDNLFDKQTEKLQKSYEKLTEALEQKLDLIDRDMKRLDSHFNRIEDDVYKAAEAFDLLNEKQDLNLNTLQTYENHYAELEQKWANKEISQADYAARLQEIYDAIYDNIDALYELDKEMREYYTDFLSNMNEEIEKYTKTFEYLTKLTEHYKNIMELTGNSKDYDKMELLYTASLKNIDNKLQVAKAEMDAAQAQYDFLMSQPNKLEEDVEAVTNQLQEKTEAYFETLEEKIEATQNLVKNGLDRAAAQLEKILTGGTTFERLNQSMSMMSKFSELFYTTTNQVYETQKRINNVTQELAKTTNKNYQNELKMWKMRLESAQKQEKLSKNQLALMDAEFKLIQARAAFEEAQNAKSTVRLTRDAEGNYGYVFTADQENITKAQQAVQDAENDLYNKQLEIANKNAELIVQIQQEMFNKIKEINDDLTLLAEERELRIQEIYQQYSPYILALTNDRNMAISYSEESTAKIMRDAWSMTFEETINQCSSWQEAYQTYTEECSKHLSQWYEVVEEVTENTGLKFDDLKKKMSNITKESDAIRIALIGEDGNGGVVEALNKVAQEILTKTSKYADFADELGKVASHYEGIADNAYKALAAMQEVADFAATGSTDTREEVYWNSDNAGEKINYYDYNGNLVQSTDISDDTKEHYKKMNEYRNKAKQEGISDSERAYYASLYQDERNKYNAGVAAEADADLTINDKYKAISDDPAWNYDKQREGFAYEQSRIDAKKDAAKNAYNKAKEDEANANAEADQQARQTAAAAAEEKKYKELYMSYEQYMKHQDEKDIFNAYIKNTKLSWQEKYAKIKDFLEDRKNNIVYKPVTSEAPEGIVSNNLYSFAKDSGVIAEYLGNYFYTPDGGKSWLSLSIKQSGITKWYGESGGTIEKSSYFKNGYKVKIKNTNTWYELPNKSLIHYNPILPSYDTGGYTGKWGPEGKLATLHEKELVLNKQDTQNILAAVSLIRQIASAIDLQALMQSFGLLSVGATKIGTLAHTNLEQRVEITAQFPNAIYHDEIKEAFDTLINRASQYANRNY